MSDCLHHQALVGIGSNIDPERHLISGAAALQARFPDVRFSQVYCSAAIGMDAGAADFLNACALFTLDDEVNVLQLWLKQIEDNHGRDRSHGAWQPRTLDLDVMQFDGVWLEDVMAYPHCYLPAEALVLLPEEKPATPNGRITIAYGVGYLGANTISSSAAPAGTIG